MDGVTTRACTDLKRKQAYGVIDSWFPSGQCHYDIEYRGANLDKASGSYCGLVDMSTNDNCSGADVTVAPPYAWRP